MSPLLKYSSSIITFYFYCVHLLQINFTVSPITPIEYIPWQWSDQFKISWEKRLFSKVTHTSGKLFYANKFTYVQQKSVPIESVGWQCPVDPSFTWAQAAVWIETDFFISVYVRTWEERMACWLFFFPKQLWHLPVDQGKNQVIPNPPVPQQHHLIIQSPPEMRSPLPHPQELWAIVLPTCKVQFFIFFEIVLSARQTAWSCLAHVGTGVTWSKASASVSPQAGSATSSIKGFAPPSFGSSSSPKQGSTKCLV